jgi:hypothetical protein
VNDKTRPDDGTRAAERAQASSGHDADRPPSADEEAAADRSRQAFAADSERVEELSEEMNEIGAHVKGEGSLE